MDIHVANFRPHHHAGSFVLYLRQVQELLGRKVEADDGDLLCEFYFRDIQPQFAATLIRQLIEVIR